MRPYRCQSFRVRSMTASAREVKRLLATSCCRPCAMNLADTWRHQRAERKHKKWRIRSERLTLLLADATRDYRVRIEIHPDEKAERSRVCDVDLSFPVFWAAPEQRRFTAKLETQQ